MLHVAVLVEPLLEVELLEANQSNHSLIGAVCVLWAQEDILSDMEKHPRSFQPRHWLKPHFYSLNCLPLISFPSLPSNISLDSFFLPSLWSSSSLLIPVLSCSCFSFLLLCLFLSLIAPSSIPFHFFSSGRLEQLPRPHRKAPSPQSLFRMTSAQKMFTLIESWVKPSGGFHRAPSLLSSFTR